MQNSSFSYSARTVQMYILDHVLRVYLYLQLQLQLQCMYGAYAGFRMHPACKSTATDRATGAGRGLPTVYRRSAGCAERCITFSPALEEIVTNLRQLRQLPLHGECLSFPEKIAKCQNP